MRTRDVLIAIAVLLAVRIPAAAQTQITTSVIEGVVVDASAAVLPGVTVEVRNADTNFARTLVTDRDGRFVARSEEHTSELQSQSNLVCRLLLEKKKQDTPIPSPHGSTITTDSTTLST